jgi:hypothetical protein
MLEYLARYFNAISSRKSSMGYIWGVGITTWPTTATSREERSFVLMWLGIIVFIVVFFVVLIYLLGRI